MDSNIDVKTAFMQAIYDCDIYKVKAILDFCKQNHCVRVLELHKALCVGAKLGQPDVVKLMVDMNPSPSMLYSDETGKKPLHHAVEMGALDVVKILIQAGAAVNVSDLKGRTSLLIASLNGHADLVRYLISAGAHVNLCRTYTDEERALHLATGAGHFEVAEVLLDYGQAIIDVKTPIGKGGFTPLHKAVKNGHALVVQLLCERGADLEIPDTRQRRAIHMAVEGGSMEVLQILINYKASLLCTDSNKRTPLHYAAGMKRREMVELFLCLGADASASDVNGDMPLHTAVMHKAEEIVPVLLEAGVDVHARSSTKGDTPLLLAASVGSARMIEALLNYGADVNSKNIENVTALHRAQSARCSSANRNNITSLLIQYGTHVNWKDSRGFNPLHCCAFQCIMSDTNLPALKLLVAAGANLRHEISGRNSSLCWLVWHGIYDSARFLVTAGWDLKEELWIHLPGKTPEQTEFHLWLQSLQKQPRSLQHLCRFCIRKYLIEMRNGQEILSTIHLLPLPNRLKGYMTFQDLF